MNRRIFLKGVGGAMVAAPFLASVHERYATAADDAIIRRSVIFHTHNGCLTNRWFPKVAHGPIDAAALTGTTLEGLGPLAEKLLFPRGLKMFNSYAEIQTVDPHDQAMGCKLTCATIDEAGDRYATSHSMDHEIARQMNPGGASPLVLSVSGGSGSNIKDVLSFSAPGEAFPAQVNPQTIYNSLTQVLSSGGGETEADYRVKRGQSVLDLVRGDLDAYKRLNMSKTDQDRIEAWAQLLRDAETPIAKAASCSPAMAEEMGVEMFIAQSGAAGSGGSSVFGSGDVSEAAYKYGASAMFRLMALSMICDTNRSFVFTYPGYAIYKFLGHSHDHHGLSHRNGSFDVGGTCVNGVLDMIYQIDTFFAEKYLELVNLLNSIEEGDRRLLDNTATMWIPELADGNSHNTNNLPIVIAGSLGGYLKQGQSVSLEKPDIDTGNSEANCVNGNDNNSNTFATSSRQGTVPINKLLLTIMNGCGCQAEGGGPMMEWGQFDSASLAAGITKPGELSELRA